MQRSIIALLLAGLTLSAATVPAVATAQSRHELRHDRQDIRQERRDVIRAERNGHWRRAEHERHELRGARREYREDLRDRRDRRWGQNDWHGWRDHNRGLYARGGWHAPFGYTAFRPGVRLRSAYYAPNYYLADPYRYRLPPIYSSQRWVRHYDDLLLVDIRTGYVRRVIRGFYW